MASQMQFMQIQWRQRLARLKGRLIGSVDPIIHLRLDTIDNRFRLHSAIASGKSSKTFFGEDMVHGGEVFIKLLLFPRSDFESALFHNEIYTLRHLDDFQPRPPSRKLLTPSTKRSTNSCCSEPSGCPALVTTV